MSSSTPSPMVLDLSHYDENVDYPKLKANGVLGIIYKSSQGTNYADNTYRKAQSAARAAGLKFGAYHFLENSDPVKQAEWFLKCANLASDELFAADWEPADTKTASAKTCADFIAATESLLGRANQALVYGSSSFLQEEIPQNYDAFFANRRLWLAQYAASVKLPNTWKTTGFWLWQYSGDGLGPKPNTVPGVSGNPDCNWYQGDPKMMLAEWATGFAEEPQGPTIYLTLSGLPTGSFLVLDAGKNVTVIAADAAA